MANYLPRLYPAFIRLLLNIAEHGNQYKGSEALPLTNEDAEKIDDVIRGIREFLKENPALLQKVGLMGPGHVVYFDFETPKKSAL